MNKDKVIIFVLVGLMLFSAVAFAMPLLMSDSSESDDKTADNLAACQTSVEVATQPGSPAGEWPATVEETDALQVLDLREGSGREAVLDDCITVHYRLSLADGTPVEGNDTFAQGQPITFELVEGGLIEGWTQGVPGLKEGGVRRLVVPPSLGYGNNDSPTIPAGSTLVFDIELIKIED